MVTRRPVTPPRQHALRSGHAHHPARNLRDLVQEGLTRPLVAIAAAIAAALAAAVVRGIARRRRSRLAHALATRRIESLRVKTRQTQDPLTRML